jgi:Tfp pilus assembly protein PilZ
MGVKTSEAERRKRDRKRQRIPVRYGPESGLHLGFTTDFGGAGLFLQGNILYPPGTVLQLTLDLPEGPRMLRGKVQWVKQVPPAFRRSLRGGMGVKLVEE